MLRHLTADVLSVEAQSQDDVYCSSLYSQDALGKHAYSKILEILPQKKKRKKKKKSVEISDIFHISAQNIDCGYLEPPRRGGSNEYPQSMFLSRNKKNNVYPCEPQFYYIKVGIKGVKIGVYSLCAICKSTGIPAQLHNHVQMSTIFFEVSQKERFTERFEHSYCVHSIKSAWRSYF